MSDVKIRAEIDASSFWDVNVTTRKALFRPMLDRLNGKEANLVKAAPDQEKAYRSLWADCMELFPAEDPTVLSKAFFQVAGSYQRDQNQKKDSFCAYFQTAMRHLKAEEARKEAQEFMNISRETARKARKALAYMEDMGYTSGMVTGNPDLEKTVAQAAGIGQRSLHEALLNKDALVSMNAERDDGTEIQISNNGPTLEEEIEAHSDDVFPLLHKAVLMMNLKERERTRNNMGLFWSPRILKYLRMREKPDIPERLGRCDDLRPLEKDGILWDQLLLRNYVSFCVQEPLYSGEGPKNPKELESAAVNALLLQTRRPEQDKTVVEYLGQRKETVSSRNREIENEFLNMIHPQRQKQNPTPKQTKAEQEER